MIMYDVTPSPLSNRRFTFSFRSKVDRARIFLANIYRGLYFAKQFTQGDVPTSFSRAVEYNHL